ncbi:hypothetical protein [Sphingomonas sp.]|uniref:hypothetical protein n=1 Tax=Sphingomonas sp. TaxID=28214 RepID=UPI001B2AE3A1|nr:hypothetical protein [Sphingomonas sp.]MBO9714799.1 hypothetical protein [Sphingomonas sp.]
MSALIKSGAPGAVRAFAPAREREPRAPAPVPAADPRDAEIARLRGEIARLGAELAEGKASTDDVILKAYEKGRGEGLRDAEVREAERLDLLERVAEDALAAFGKRLDLLEALAPALAWAALDKLFADRTDWRDMTEAALARQLDALRRDAVLRVLVSSIDFPEGVSLPLIAGASVEREAGLRGGACRIECRLGEVEIDVREQWSALAALLEQMGEEA